MDYSANSNMSVSAKMFLTDSTEDPEASVQRQEGNRGRGSTIRDLNKWETRSQSPPSSCVVSGNYDVTVKLTF